MEQRTRFFTKENVIIVGTVIICMLFMWLIGFGFGNEVRLSKILGQTFLGSDVYLGTWFGFVMIIPIGIGIPYLVIRNIFHEKIQNYGFSFGDTKFGAKWLIFLMPAFVFIPLGSAYIGTETYYTYLVLPDFLKPINIAIHCVSYGLFVIGFEFLFRGFLLFGLNRNMGDTSSSRWIAIIISSAFSAAFLIGLPWVFAVSALLSGIPGGWLNLRLRSFVYFAFIHWNIGVWSDIWEIIKLNISNGIF
jgi:hypothetical protein